MLPGTPAYERGMSEENVNSVVGTAREVDVLNVIFSIANTRFMPGTH